jgi:hypothetical protein
MIISFNEEKHAYTNEAHAVIPSVTQILGTVYGTGLENAPAYFVNRAADKGTAIHKAIESYLNDGKKSTIKEFIVWQKWYEGFKNKPFDSEKIIYAQTPNGAFAGTLDFLCDGWVYDWKTCKTATRQQIQKWQKQLSFYTYALRQMGYAVNEPGKILHLTDTYEVINVDYLGDEFVEKTMALYKEIKDGKKTQEQAILSEQKELETVSQKELQTLEDVLMQIQALELVAEDYRAKIKAEMERRGILDLQVGRVKMTLIPGTIRQTFDTRAFRNDDPALYAIYLKNTEVKPSLRITVK